MPLKLIHISVARNLLFPQIPACQPLGTELPQESASYMQCTLNTCFLTLKRLKPIPLRILAPILRSFVVVVMLLIWPQVKKVNVMYFNCFLFYIFYGHVRNNWWIQNISEHGSKRTGSYSFVWFCWHETTEEMTLGEENLILGM